MRTIGIALLLAALSTGALAQPEDHYWELGVGCYYGGAGGLSDLDVARYDWLYLCFGNIAATPETVAEINRLLEINPDLKVVIRVWPIMGQGDCPENRHQATFLHYLYKPGVKEGVLANIAAQVSVVLDNISRPENVVGLTFLEELPGHFSGDPFRSNVTGGPLSWDLERFRSEIEAERGKPLVWDDETRLWWGEKWVQVLGQIHATMKQASGGRLVWYYQQTNHTSLDMVPEGTPLETRMLVPVRWADIIKPGVCDGFFAYPNNQAVWERYLRLAQEHDWLFFSQVSHPGGMRLCPWDECLAMAKQRVPENMGYFLYCPGDCAARNAWNDDPEFAGRPEANVRGVSRPQHWRRILAREDVGMDVVRAYPPLRLHVDLPLAGAESGGMIHPRAIVENAREASFFLDAAEAVAHDVTVTLAVPEGFAIDPNASAPPTLDLGDLQPGELRVADWWVSVPLGFDGTLAGPFALTAKADQGRPTQLSLADDAAIPLAQVHEVGASGAWWIEPGFRLASDVRPAVVIECIDGTVTNPSVGDERVRVRYQGVLERGMRLEMRPAGSTLTVLPLAEDDGASRADAGDPTGFRAFDDGYLVARVNVGRQVEPGATLRVSAAGKVEGGEQNHVVLRFVLEGGETTDVGALTNRFGADWREVSAEVTVPEGVIQLQQVFLYRLKQQGRVWYGPVRIELAGAARPEDISARVSGSFPTLPRGTFTVIRYEDDDTPTVRARARVQLVLPE
ncbi:MAG: hypothetical protein AB7Y46_07240 [Armatimonadota bacterium]